ncbi:MAG: YggS family pyridoxal phosphate-dependent enzyme [Phycisphaerae bacterium]|jgi:pyridoxal phosphate enzyme (YggS family)
MQPSITAKDIAANIAHIRARMARVAVEAGRDPVGISLIAISKTQAPEAIEAAIGAGHLVFGENRVQEALLKFPALKAAHPRLELHLVGPLQSNKVRDAVALFDVVHTLDRESLAVALLRERERAGRCPRLFVQVNTGEEPQKAGLSPRDTLPFIDRCRAEWNLQIEGLMCIPPVDDMPAPHFALLSKLAQTAGLRELSMGMSGDFEAAIALGATFIRVGSAIFGERPASPA